MADWAGFLQSSASASATLIGLVVVAVSINLTRILEIQHLPGRAAAALAPLAAVLIIALLGLVPSQPDWAFGVEVLGAGATIWAYSNIVVIRHISNSSQRPAIPAWRLWSNLALNQLQSLPFIIAGMLLLWRMPSGVAWIVPGVIFSLVAGLVNAWVLLVEIVR